ncbi:hypothetical protein [Nocardioides sp.]|uniref:hypothetical protein n=1 Tax=Nocardioides sp. TaxID=35761 RepID=UPI00262DEFD5|nr:hypothetical protein [Nocardioides sp.]MDI6910941.1 hypothetical protein [Nocardioides sp.]
MLPLGTTTDVLRRTASYMAQVMCRDTVGLDPALRRDATRRDATRPERRGCIHFEW